MILIVCSEPMAFEKTQEIGRTQPALGNFIANAKPS